MEAGRDESISCAVKWVTIKVNEDANVIVEKVALGFRSRHRTSAERPCLSSVEQSDSCMLHARVMRAGRVKPAAEEGDRAAVVKATHLRNREGDEVVADVNKMLSLPPTPVSLLQ